MNFSHYTDRRPESQQGHPTGDALVYFADSRHGFAVYRWTVEFWWQFSRLYGVPDVCWREAR